MYLFKKIFLSNIFFYKNFLLFLIKIFFHKNHQFYLMVFKLLIITTNIIIYFAYSLVISLALAK